MLAVYCPLTTFYSKINLAETITVCCVSIPLYFQTRIRLSYRNYDTIIHFADQNITYPDIHYLQFLTSCLLFHLFRSVDRSTYKYRTFIKKIDMNQKPLNAFWLTVRIEIFFIIIVITIGFKYNWVKNLVSRSVIKWRVWREARWKRRGQKTY